jgi:hypothetical protein
MMRLLEEQRSVVLDDALVTLDRTHPAHYDAAGRTFTRDQLAALFDLVLDALRERRLERVTDYCAELAQRRFEGGFGIGEVQTAFNALEASMWQQLIAGVPADELAESIGLLSTVLGAGKDALARRYVSLAAQRHVPSLNLAAMFEGTNG